MSKRFQPPVGASRAWSALTAFVAALALIGAGTPPACAQDATAPGGLQIFATPYLWLGGIHETIETPIPRAPSVSADISAIDVLEHLSAVPFMGSLEFATGPSASSAMPCTYPSVPGSPLPETCSAAVTRN